MTKKDGKKKKVTKKEKHATPIWDFSAENSLAKKESQKKKRGRKKKEASLDETINDYFSALIKEEAGDYQEEKKGFKKRFFSWYYALIVVLVILISSSFLLIAHQYERLQIKTNQMSTTLKENSYVLYKEGMGINRFNVVLVENNGKKETLRVIGMPGDKVEMKEDVLTINDAVYDEVYLKGNYVDFKLEENQLKQNYTLDFSVSTISKGKETGQNIPENSYILLGDNRQGAVDSRKTGFYTEDEIKGVILMKFWPLSELGPVE